MNGATPLGDQVAAEIIVVEHARDIELLQLGDGGDRCAVGVRFETMHRRVGKVPAISMIARPANSMPRSGAAALE